MPSSTITAKQLCRAAALACACIVPAYAQQAAGPYDAALNVRNLCAATSEQTLELEPIHDTVVYRFENQLYRASGVRREDTAEEANSKVRRYLNENMPRLLCNQFNFNPAGGNLLKLAIARSSDPFLDRALGDWKVDLNQIDKVDGATVLDYVETRRKEAGSNANLVRIYDQYWNRLRKAGAKRASELPAPQR